MVPKVIFKKAAFWVSSRQFFEIKGNLFVPTDKF